MHCPLLLPNRSGNQIAQLPKRSRLPATRSLDYWGCPDCEVRNTIVEAVDIDR
jgi:hypothetical protein